MAKLVVPSHTPYRRRARTPEPSLPNIGPSPYRHRARTPSPNGQRARTLDPPRRAPSPHRYRECTPEPPRVLTPERRRECTPEEGLRVPSPQRHGRERTPEPTGPVIESTTYGGVIDEMADYLHPLRSNENLQKEFLILLKQPGRNLAKLSNELKAVQEALVTGPEPMELQSFPDINSKLSAAPPLRLEEVKALTVATDTFRELSGIAVRRILSLTPEEKANLFILFKKLPLSSSVHCFIRPSFSESDSLYSQLLKKIGFGESRGRLIYVADDSGVDRITLAITAIHAVTKLE